MIPSHYLVKRHFFGLFFLAEQDFLQIEWSGFDEFAEALKGMESEFYKHLMKELTKYGLLVEEGAKALVYQDEGDLAASINFGQAIRQGNKVIVRGGTNMKQAVRLHEKPAGGKTHDKYDNGARFIGYYKDGKGARTRAKPNWRGFQPGRKYLQNAVTATEQDFEDACARALEKTLGGLL